MLTLLAFIFTLGLLVTIHEYGHYLVAKWCGVKVLKFSVGFGRPIFSKKIGRDQMEFIIAMIPLGGYVQMLEDKALSSESNTMTDADKVRALNRQSVGKRMAIVLAGSAANLLLAVVLYWILFVSGVVGIKPVLGAVVEQSPAAIAGFVAGEQLQEINGKSIKTWQEARLALLTASLNGRSVEIQVLDQSQTIHRRQLESVPLSDDDASQDVMAVLGFSPQQPSVPARMGSLIKEGPADLAGLKANDIVLRVDQKAIATWDDLVKEVRDHPKQALNILVRRGQQELLFVVTPESVWEHGKNIGRIGAEFKLEQAEMDKIFITQHYSVAEAFLRAVEKTWDTALFSLRMLGNMLLGQISWKSVSGPVTIASYAGQSAHMGVSAFVAFLALMSVSIGVLNLLPIPVLDGGYFMYHVAEVLIGRPLSESTMVAGQKIGLFLLGLLMIIAFYNDINRLITG